MFMNRLLVLHYTSAIALAVLRLLIKLQPNNISEKKSNSIVNFIGCRCSTFDVDLLREFNVCNILTL